MNIVKIGSIVTFKILENDIILRKELFRPKTREIPSRYRGPYDSGSSIIIKQDPKKNQISIESPVGKALFNSKVGENISYIANDKRLHLLIIKIEG